MMFEIIISQPGQGDALGKLAPGSYIVGSDPQSHIQLDLPEVSSRHAQFIVRDNVLYVIDLNSSNGTYVDGSLLVPNTPVETHPGSVIKIGRLNIVAKGPATEAPAASVVSPAAPPPAPSAAPSQAPSAGEAPRPKRQKVPKLTVSGVPDAARPVIQEIKRHAHAELLKRLNLKKMVLSGIDEKALEERAKVTIREVLSELSIPLPAGVSPEMLEREMIQEAIGLGPLDYMIERDDITEIMVNGPNQVFVEMKGVLYRTDTAFADNAQVMAAIERIVSPLGRRIDESSPMVDARLPDGSRVNAIIPPLSLIGPSITIRKFSKNPYQVSNLIEFGTLTAEMAQFLEASVLVRKNIVISGGTGSGKTTLLNVLSSFLPNRERIVTVEDAAELQLNQEHVVRLESRPPNIEGRGEITIRDLVRNSLRMRPDRIVVGECRGGEALDMLQAMNTGHDGSLTTIHANTPRDCLSRLETLVLMAGFDLPLRAIREQITSAICLVVQVSRQRDGSRKITNISEITKMEGEIITMQDIFVFTQTGWDEENRIVGYHEPTGNIPSFMDEIERAKIDLNISIFDPKKYHRKK